MIEKMLSRRMLNMPQAQALAPEPNEVRLRYRGTNVRANPEAPENQKQLQQQIADKLSQLDFKPDVRIAHFRWLEKYPVHVIGWSGTIEGMEPTPQGVLVRVRIWPDVVPINDRTVLMEDQVFETYLYAKGVLQPVGWEDLGPNPVLHPF